MVHIRKSIDIISPSDGKRYTSLREYEKSLESKGQHIMSEKHYKAVREQCLDLENSKAKPKPPEHNHVHIDFNNGRITTSRENLNDR